MISDVLRLLPTQTATHEEAFEARYVGLVARACQLGLARAEAEDLVHDAYVLFVLARPDLATITNLDGYLFVIVRNLHVSNVRRAARFRSEPLSAIDYDSAELSWRDAHPLLRFERREALLRICHYGLRRAPSSKAGSALLLRYFLGFYPTEIAKLLLNTPRNIDDLLIEARREARAHLAIPRQLALLRAGAEPQLADTAGDDGRYFLERTRALIFSRAHERCFSTAFFGRAYDSPAASDTFDAEVTARLVTCAQCLDEACQRLGLPRLAERFPTDTLGPSSRSGGAGARAGAAPQVRASLRRRMIDAIEHRPRVLCVTVNGLVVESHRVGREVIDHTLALTCDEPLAFVDVVSDQGVQLAQLNLDPFPHGALRQATSVELSRGCTLDLSVDFSEHRPTLHVVYRPAAEAVAVVGVSRASEGEPAPREPNRAHVDPSFLGRLLEWLRLPRRRARLAFAAVAIVSVAWLGSSTSAAAVVRDAVRAVMSAIDGMFRPAAPVPPPPPPRSPSATARPRLREVPVPEPVIPQRQAKAIDLEIEALWKLHQLGALLGEQVSIERKGTALVINARVETDARRAELQRALSVVADRGARVHVDTFQQAAAAAANAPVPARAVTYSVGVTADRFAASAAVRRHFVAQFGLEEDPRVAVAVRDYAAHAQETTRRLALHVFALQRIVRRASPDSAPDMSAAARVTHGVLVHEYAGSVERWAGELAQHLEPVFGGVDETDTPVDITAQAAALDAGVRKTFGAEIAAPGDAAVEGSALVGAARGLERAAGEIRRQHAP